MYCSQERLFRTILFDAFFASNGDDATKSSAVVAGVTRDACRDVLCLLLVFKTESRGPRRRFGKTATFPPPKNQTNRVFGSRSFAWKARSGALREGDAFCRRTHLRRAARNVIGRPIRRSTFLSAKPVYGTGRGLMSQISLAYWSMVRSELNLPEKAVEMMEDSVQPAWFLYASSTFAWHSM